MVHEKRTKGWGIACLALALLVPSAGGGRPPAGEKPWPGGSESERVDITQPDMGNNMSGAVWNPTREKLWLVSNSGIVWRMSCGSGLDPLDAASWTVDFEGGYAAKWIVGDDTEAITQAGWDDEAIFVGVERDGGGRRLVREYDVSGNLGVVSLTNTWTILEMQSGAANSGLEALTFVPDDWLAHGGFVDRNGDPYPASVFETGGLFFAGLQSNGHVFVVDLDRRVGSPAGTYAFVGEYETGQTEIAGLEFDRSNGALLSWHNYDWRTSDPDDRLQVLLLSPLGSGTIKLLPAARIWLGPRVANNEGIALVSVAEAFGHGRMFFLTTDGGGTSNSVGIYPSFPIWHDLPRIETPVTGVSILSEQGR